MILFGFCAILLGKYWLWLLDLSTSCVWSCDCNTAGLIHLWFGQQETNMAGDSSHLFYWHASWEHDWLQLVLCVVFFRKPSDNAYFLQAFSPFENPSERISYIWLGCCKNKSSKVYIVCCNVILFKTVFILSSFNVRVLFAVKLQ